MIESFCFSSLQLRKCSCQAPAKKDETCFVNLVRGAGVFNATDAAVGDFVGKRPSRSPC